MRNGEAVTVAGTPALQHMPEDVRVPKAAELVARVLRRAIVDGTLREGDPLPHEGLLMRQFNVGRTTVREALRVLEAEGLLVVVRGASGGARIRVPGAMAVARYASMLLQYEGATAGDVHEARVLVEPAAAALLARHSPNEEIAAELEAILDSEETAGEPGDLARAEGRFHDRLVRLTGNETLIMLNSVANLIVGHQYQRLAAQRRGTWTMGDDADQAHRRLVRLIRVGAAIEAEHLWHAHLAEEGNRLIPGPAAPDSAITEPAAGERVARASETIASEIRLRILSGALAAGTRLPPELELTAAYGVSRPTIRESLRILESDHLITIRRGKQGGAIIEPPSTDVLSRHAGLLLQYRGATLDDILAAKALIEPPAAAAVARNRDPEAIRRLHDLIDAETRHQDSDYHAQELGERFHELLVELAGNQTLRIYAAMINGIVRRHLSRLGTTQAEHRARLLSEHRRLMELVEVGAALEAEAFWREHLSHFNERVLREVPQGTTALDVMS